MSFSKNSLKRQERAVDLARIRAEGGELIRDLTASEPAKAVAERTGLPARYVYNLREGAHQPSWPHLIALAQAYPELRAAIARWLNLNQPVGQQADRALGEIRRIVATLPEEGDREP